MKKVGKGLLVAAILGVLLLAVPVMAAESDSKASGSQTEAASTQSFKDGFHQDPDSSDWYYYTSGVPDKSMTGVIKGTVNGTNAWWNVVKGKVTPGVTVAKNDNGWWYIDKEGKVDFTYTGFAKNDNGEWYCEKGKVTFKKQGIIKDEKGAIGAKGDWYYVIGSKVQTNFTGLSNFSNEKGWWYIKKGKVDFTHNGVEKNKNGWWYVTNGKVQTGFTGLANYSNKNGWWYIKNGKVDFTHEGVEKNKNGWWYVSGGKVDFSYNGIATNSNGMWVVKNGKVNFNYNGTYKSEGISYKVTNGKAALPNGMSQSMYKKAQSMSSSTQWLILVDTSACRVGIFNGSKGSWTAKQYWKCTPGKPSTPTVKGTFTVKSKGRSFGTDSYTCWYYTQFHGNYLFHSVLYQPGSKTKIQDGRLGQQLSHGCVRLSIENAKWIYDNIPIGTKVYVY